MGRAVTNQSDRLPQLRTPGTRLRRARHVLAGAGIDALDAIVGVGVAVTSACGWTAAQLSVRVVGEFLKFLCATNDRRLAWSPGALNLAINRCHRGTDATRRECRHRYVGPVLPQSAGQLSAGGFVRYQEFPPDKSLAPWVKCFWLLEDSPVPVAPLDAVVPDGCPEIIVHYGDRFTEDTAGRRIVQPDAIVAGQLTRPLMLRPMGHVGMVAVRFRAEGLFPILGVPMHELVDQRVPLETICGDVSALQARIAEAGSDRERVSHLATFLERKLAERRALDAVIQHTVLAILATGGQISPDQLAQRAGMTVRQLERRFQVSVGVSPKFLCRIVRFRAIFDRLQGSTPWSTIALDCGFFDQSHLIRMTQQ